MNFDIRYVTEYRYAGLVVDNINVLRVKPATTPSQRPSGFSISIDPEVRVYEHVDYFGTTVHQFEVTRLHSQLTIEVATRCQTHALAPPPDSTWDEIQLEAYTEAGAEFLILHEAARPHPLLDELRAACLSDTPLQTVRSLCALIPKTFEYRKGVTYVGSTVADLLEGRAGVCQDFVHVMLAVLRGMGVACRYCSGYLFTTTADERQSVEVDTHAWLEAMLPDGSGGWRWVGFDPTNAIETGQHHVKIGHGRWYSDVPPIKGVFRGSGGGELSAHVTMTMLADGAPAPKEHPLRGGR